MKISVVMTAYNLEDCIGAAMDSVLNSTHKDLELIVVEDCSTDKTLDIIKAYSEKDDRVKLIQHSRNLGAGYARRTGIEASIGDYVITIDGDDTITDSFLKSLADKAEETNADIVSGGITIVNLKDDYIETRSWGNRRSVGIQKYMDYNEKRIIFLNNKIVRRSLYATKEEREKGGVNGKTSYCIRRYCEDTPVVIPLMYYANEIVYCDNTGYIYNMRSTSLTHTVDAFQENLFKALCAADCLKFFESKEKEYQCLMNVPEFIMYMKNARAAMTTEGLQKYISEWCEATCKLLDFIK